MLATKHTKQNIAVFTNLYDRYAPAFYGEIKRNLYQQEICNQILVVSFQQIWEKMADPATVQQPSFIWCYQIVRKEINRKKVELILKEIFACQQVTSTVA